MNSDRNQCGLSSLLPMSCRGRAEAFARRLHSRLRSLGTHTTSPTDTDENSWLATHENTNTVTSLQPRHNSDGDIFFDFGILESPGSPVEEIPDTEFSRLITNQQDDLPTHEPCSCTVKVKSSDPDSGYSFSSPVTEDNLNDSDSSEYYDPENSDVEVLACNSRQHCSNHHNKYVEKNCRRPVSAMHNHLPESFTCPNLKFDIDLKNEKPDIKVKSEELKSRLQETVTEESEDESSNGVNGDEITKCSKGYTDNIQEGKSLKEQIEDVHKYRDCREIRITENKLADVCLENGLGDDVASEESYCCSLNIENNMTVVIESVNKLDIVVNEKVDENGYRIEGKSEEVENRLEEPHKEEIVSEEKGPEDKILEEKVPEEILIEGKMPEEILSEGKVPEDIIPPGTDCYQIEENVSSTCSSESCSTIASIIEKFDENKDGIFFISSSEYEIEDTDVTKNDIKIIYTTEEEISLRGNEKHIEDITSPTDESLLLDHLKPEHENSETEDKSKSDEDDEETDERTPRVRRCSSLKTGKTPPGTPGRKKIVRFADVLGLDLADVRTFMDEIPKVPTSAYTDLIDADLSESDSNMNSTNSLTSRIESMSHGQKPDKILVPMFQQPGGQGNFLEKIKEFQCCLENACVEDTIALSISGIVRVRNLDFHKSVHIRYSLDSWKTYADLQATYIPNSCDGFSDKFSFLLYVHTLGIGQRVEFAVRFQCKGCQYWDNNHGVNYCFQCLPASNNTPFLPITGPEEHWSGASFY